MPLTLYSQWEVPFFAVTRPRPRPGTVRFAARWLFAELRALDYKGCWWPTIARWLCHGCGGVTIVANYVQ